MYDEAVPIARGYELLRVAGPDARRAGPGLPHATAAINDAPRDELDMEDEVFTAERNRAFERAQLASGSASTASWRATGHPARSPA